MTELLQFMYQGVVNVKHAELSQFMKIAQTLQIKGLATSNNNNGNGHGHDSHHRRSPTLSPHHHSHRGGGGGGVGGSSDNGHGHGNDGVRNLSTSALDYPLNNIIENKIHSALLNSLHSSTASLANTLKRSASEFGNLSSIESPSPNLLKKHKRLSSDGHDNDMSRESMDENEEVFMPQVSMETPRFDLNSVKREANEIISSSAALRTLLPAHFNFDYNGAYKSNADYSNDSHNNNDLEKLSAAAAAAAAVAVSNANGSVNHMDIPPGKDDFEFELLHDI